jgi:hypothetical protein
VNLPGTCDTRDVESFGENGLFYYLLLALKVGLEIARRSVKLNYLGMQFVNMFFVSVLRCLLYRL